MNEWNLDKCSNACAKELGFLKIVQETWWRKIVLNLHLLNVCAKSKRKPKKKSDKNEIKTHCFVHLKGKQLASTTSRMYLFCWIRENKFLKRMNEKISGIRFSVKILSKWNSFNGTFGCNMSTDVLHFYFTLHFYRDLCILHTINNNFFFFIKSGHEIKLTVNNQTHTIWNEQKWQTEIIAWTNCRKKWTKGANKYSGASKSNGVEKWIRKIEREIYCARYSEIKL